MNSGTTRYTGPAAVIVGILSLAALHSIFLGNPPYVDEPIHYDEIIYLANGGAWRVNPLLPMIPGYHVLMAQLVSLTGWSTLEAVRNFTFVFSVLSIVIFWRLAYLYLPEAYNITALQFMFLPLNLPYYFLAYTEMLSLCLVLGMLLAGREKKYAVASVLGLAALLVRQNNIVWVIFAFVINYYDDNGWTWAPSKWKRYAPFLIPVSVFSAFVVINGEVALGEKINHPSETVYSGNILFLLFMMFILFVPSIVGDMRRIWNRVWSPVGVGAFGLIVFLFIFNFSADHPYNQYEFYIRNLILMKVEGDYAPKTLFVLIIFCAAMFIIASPRKEGWWVLYVFSVMFLAPSWLIEQRYYIIPITLFLLGRIQRSTRTERAQLVYLMILSAGTFYLVNMGVGL